MISLSFERLTFHCDISNVLDSKFIYFKRFGQFLAFDLKMANQRNRMLFYGITNLDIVSVCTDYPIEDSDQRSVFHK